MKQKKKTYYFDLGEYYCHSCKQTHHEGSEKGKAHQQYKIEKLMEKKKKSTWF